MLEATMDEEAGGSFWSWPHWLMVWGQGINNPRHKIQCAMSLFNMQINKENECEKTELAGFIVNSVFLVSQAPT